jgi:hypothetical protein
MPEWSAWREWWMDLLKSGIVFALGAFITALVLNRLEDRRAANRFVSEAAFQLRVRALDDFRRYTLRYLRAAIAAYTELYQWVLVVDRAKLATMHRYEQEAYEDFSVAMEEVRIRFAEVPECVALIAALDASNKKRHRIYDLIVDAKLDGIEDFRSRPAADRTAFNSATYDVMDLRERVLQLLEQDAERRIPKRRAA